jgi:hypothetical protein
MIDGPRSVISTEEREGGGHEIPQNVGAHLDVNDHVNKEWEMGVEC